MMISENIALQTYYKEPLSKNGILNYPNITSYAKKEPELFPGWLAAFAQVGMWLFYLPGQVLLVLSGRKEPTK